MPLAEKEVRRGLRQTLKRFKMNLLNLYKENNHLVIFTTNVPIPFLVILKAKSLCTEK